MYLNLCNDNCPGLAHRLAGAAPQAILRSYGVGLDGKIEDFGGANFDALLTTVTPIGIHMDQVDFKIPELLYHGEDRFIFPRALSTCSR